ncbi:MAG: hypothetical protein U0800_03975 [Isosphaeraceae bacterium]
MPTPKSFRIALGMGVLLAGWSAARPASGQMPQPYKPNVEERSGLLTRFKPIQPILPHDQRRDDWYDTRWADKPDISHPNSCTHGGLYGLRYANRCTESVYPFFMGAPGASTIGPECKPADHELIRLYDNFIHPWRPVGMYYSKGSYVPIYDLDPIAPGPGPFPYRHFWTHIRGG